MKKQLQVKVEAVADIKSKFQSSELVILADYRGVNVAEMTGLRRKLRDAGIEFRIVKNTLTRRATQELGLEELDTYLKGPTAVAYSADPVLPAKIFTEVSRTLKTFKIKAGVLQGKVITNEEIKALADLPSREQLLAKVAGCFQAPIAGLVNVLAGNMRNLVYVLEAIRQQKEEAA